MDGCSEELKSCTYCKREFSTQGALNSHVGQVHDNQIEKECNTCGSKFKVIKSREDSARFCSNNCRAKWQSEAFQGEGGPGWKGGKEVYECTECGDKIEQWASQGGTEFCNQECYFKWLRKNAPTGEDHHSYLNGERAYGRGWNDRKKEEIRKRDGYECQDCGMANEDHLQEVGASLHVHHVIPHRKFEEAEEANDPSNLTTLCSYCHMKRESEYWKTEMGSAVA